MVTRILLSFSLWATVVATAAEPAHPFILWTRDEAAVIRQRVETEPWAKAASEKMLAETGLGKTYRNLFRYVVMGDAAAGEAEKKYLLGIIGTHPRNFEKLEHGGRHYDCSLDVLRYDACYDLLNAEERAKIEETFRAYIAYQLEDKKVYTRTSWLPNMQWPRPLAAHLMAVGLRDQQLIDQLAASNGGWKWYFDDYIADGQFYMEEFGKHYSMIGEMLLFCRGLERLGRHDLGFGYTGKGGATMRRYLESILAAGYPRTQIPGGKPDYRKITMGDAMGSPFGLRPFEHSVVPGQLPDGKPKMEFWRAANMNGRDHKSAKVDKMLAPHWFEIAHAQWPDAGFDYFLAQMRDGDAAQYVPSLFWGLAPIDAATVKPPAAPSFVAPERGFAFLRAEESPAYWESPAPAVALQFAMLYVHYVADCFSLLGYQAFHRPIYINKHISAGYNGGPYDFHVRSHCGVVVDGLQAQPIGPVPVASEFSGPVKYVFAHTAPPAAPYAGNELRSTDQPKTSATQIYPGVELSRGLLLTREYLFDVFHLTSDKPRQYHWLVHALGDAKESWPVTDELQRSLFDVPEIKIGEARRRDVGQDGWSLTTLQTRYAGATTNRLPAAWFDRKIGVRVWMLGEAGTTAYYYRPPLKYQSGERAYRAGEGPADFDETGAISVAVARHKPVTTFVALHEPFENGAGKLREFSRIEQTDRAVAARVTGAGVDDRVLLWFANAPAEPVTLAGNGESFTFRGYGHIRVGKDRVEVTGAVTACKVRVPGQPLVVVNGREQAGLVSGGWLEIK